MIRRLLKCVREFKLPMILTPLCVVMEVVLEIIIPRVMAAIIDNGVDKGDVAYIIKMGMVLLLCALFSMLFGVLAGKFASDASCGFARNLRHDIFYNIQNFSFANIDKFSTSSLITRLTTDITNVQMSFQMLTRMAFRSPIMMVSALISSFTISAKLSVIFVCVLPVLGLGLYLIMTRVHPTFRRVFKTYDKLNNVVGENLSGVRVVKSYNREEHEIEKFNSISGEIYNDFTYAEKVMAFNGPLMQVCMYTCMLLISWFGARIIVNSGATELTTGQLTSFITYTTQILMGLMMVSILFVMLTMSRASAERIIEVLAEESTLTNPDNALCDVNDGSICFENVGFSYYNKADKNCLEGINLTIKSGETVGIIGGTGSSKTTLVQLIPRLYDATEGRVLVGGKDVREYDLDSLRNSVAMVLQKNVLFSGTIKDNLRWGNENASDEEIVHACKLACADEFIESFPDKYDTYIEQGGTNVSGGQKQRLCIARALLKKPRVLIMDDSTSAVDTRTDAFIRHAMLTEIPDTTKLIIAQRISSVMDADKIVVLDKGRIVGCGTHTELMASNEVYREVYESQMKEGDK